MSSFHYVLEVIKCDCGQHISINDIGDSIQAEIDSLGFVAWEVETKDEYECTNCGRGYILEFFAEVEEDDNGEKDFPSASDFNIYNYELQELGIQAVYHDNKRHVLSDYSIGDKVDLPDGHYILSYGEYVIMDRTLTNVFNPVHDEDQMSFVSVLEEVS